MKKYVINGKQNCILTTRWVGGGEGGVGEEIFIYPKILAALSCRELYLDYIQIEMFSIFLSLQFVSFFLFAFVSYQ